MRHASMGVKLDESHGRKVRASAQLAVRPLMAMPAFFPQNTAF